MRNFILGIIVTIVVLIVGALAFALLIVVLLFRPSGLLGSTVREKV